METKIIARIAESLQRQKKVAVIRIIGRKSSAPRDIGSVCVVDEDGHLTGSVGGGYIEYRAIEEAKMALQQRGSSSFPFSLSPEEIAREGLICGLDVELFIETVFPGDSDAVALFQNIFELQAEGGHTVTLLTPLGGSDRNVDLPRHLVVDGMLRYGDLEDVVSWCSAQPFELIHRESGDWFCETFQPQPELIIFGAGHVGEAISRLAKELGFFVILADDRPEFRGVLQNPWVDNGHLISFDGEAVRKVVADGSHVVIATRSHVHDARILEIILLSGRVPAYIGMVGSRRKKRVIYKKMLALGVAQETLDRVNLPIGLDIGAQSPMEIAISVLAEIISVRNRGRAGAEVSSLKCL